MPMRISLPRIVAKWNLPRLAADLAAHLKALEHADDLWSTGEQSDDFLEPYNLSHDDAYWVKTIAWGKQCVDCGDVWDYYMVNDAVWTTAGLKPRQCCCRKCLAARLGRPLEPADFWRGRGRPSPGRIKAASS